MIKYRIKWILFLPLVRWGKRS